MKIETIFMLLSILVVIFSVYHIETKSTGPGINQTVNNNSITVRDTSLKIENTLIVVNVTNISQTIKISGNTSVNIKFKFRTGGVVIRTIKYYLVNKTLELYFERVGDVQTQVITLFNKQLILPSEPKEVYVIINGVKYKLEYSNGVWYGSEVPE